MDIPLVGGTFMWSSNRKHPSWSIIGRFVISPDWEAHFPDLIQETTSKVMLRSLSYLIQGNPSYYFCKLKALQEELEDWKCITHKKRRRKRSLFDKLQGMEGVEKRGLFEEERLTKIL